LVVSRWSSVGGVLTEEPAVAGRRGGRLSVAVVLPRATHASGKLEFYLARRYADEWPAYVARVPWKAVPGVW
jgi:hypothetical protein